MDPEFVRMLFEAIRQDITALKQDVGIILAKHEREIEDLQAFRWRWVGALAVIAGALELGVKFIEHALK